jgi:glycosyltransferase involved in cell wall biosynthesis
MSKTTIVVPCHDEAKRLDVAAFRRFASQSSDVRIFFVNDGSTDNTSQIIEQLRILAPQSFETVHLPCNCGKAEAVRQGMLRALPSVTDYVGFWDADGATPLEMIDAFCGVLRRRPDIEMVFGTRLPLLGRSIRRSYLRGILGGLFARCASLLLGFRVRDTQCGAKLFRSSPIVRGVFQRPFLSRWIFDVEILGRLIDAERHLDLPPVHQMVYELPLDHWHDVAGGSLKARDFWRAIVDLAAIYWHYLRPGVETQNADLSQWTLDATGRREVGQAPDDQARRPRAA